MKKKLFSKSTILKKNCTKKITFCLILPRKMRKFCFLRAYSKSTILKKKLNLKSTISKKNFFSKKHDFERKSFCKKRDFANFFFVLSVFVSTFSQRVRFGIKNITTRQILNNLPKSITCTFHIVVIHITMYSYSLQYLRQLDNSIRLRSYNTFCTRFRKDFHF